MVKKLFLMRGIANALDGSENGFISCVKELPNLQVSYMYIDESNDDPFQDEVEESNTAKSKKRWYCLQRLYLIIIKLHVYM